MTSSWRLWGMSRPTNSSVVGRLGSPAAGGPNRAGSISTGSTVTSPAPASRSSPALKAESAANASHADTKSGSCERPTAHWTAVIGSCAHSQRAGVMLCESSSLRHGSSSTRRTRGA